MEQHNCNGHRFCSDSAVWPWWTHHSCYSSGGLQPSSFSFNYLEFLFLTLRMDKSWILLVWIINDCYASSMVAECMKSSVEPVVCVLFLLFVLNLFFSLQFYFKSVKKKNEFCIALFIAAVKIVIGLKSVHFGGRQNRKFNSSYI